MVICETNSADPAEKRHAHEQVVALITVPEKFYVCSQGASAYSKSRDHDRIFTSDPVLSKTATLLLTAKIHEMRRIAHRVSGGLVIPCRDEDHNAEGGAKFAKVPRADPDVPCEQRTETARFCRGPGGRQRGWQTQHHQPA